MSAPLPDSADTLDIIAVLYRRHRADLCRRAQSYVGSRDAAEDIVHEVFRRIVERADRIHSRLNSGYLHRAVRNEALHWIERRRVRLEWRTYVQHAMPFTAPTPADELRDRDRARVLSWAMKGLPRRGCPPPDVTRIGEVWPIGRAPGCSPPTARTFWSTAVGIYGSPITSSGTGTRLNPMRLPGACSIRTGAGSEWYRCRLGCTRARLAAITCSVSGEMSRTWRRCDDMH